MNKTFIKEYTKRLFKPQISKLSLICTYKCNHKCVTCNIWTRYLNGKEEEVNNELSLKEIYHIIARNKLMALSLTGGEVFLRDDIEQIVYFAMECVPFVNIVTNGSKPDKIAYTVGNGCRHSPGSNISVSVSLEGNTEQHDKFTGVDGSFTKAVETLNRLKDLQSIYKNINITIEQLVSERTKDGFKYVRGLADKLGLEITYTIEQTANYYKRPENGLKLVKSPNPTLRFSSTSIANAMYVYGSKLPINRKGCVAGEYDCFIDPYGEIVPCVHFIDVAGYGNVRKSEYIIEKIKDRKVITGNCHGCWTPCEAYSTMMFRPLRLLR
jgi:MoaA/NifB/PqqE/SkfB family radical SAM enzyme